MTVAPRKPLAKIKDETVYYEHQIVGIRQMAGMDSFLLADDMGLGKTLQALTVAAVDFERGWVSRVLVVAPATLKWNWAQEIEDHTKFTYSVLEGSPRQRETILSDFSADILIVNYEQVKPHLTALNSMNFGIVVFDEAHYIKSHKSQRTKACLKLNMPRSFLLTGSPMLNHVNELWSLLHRIAPSEYPNYFRFVHRYAVFGGYKNKQIISLKNKDELDAAVQKVMLRRLKKDVLDLPEKQYINVPVGFHPHQRSMYDEALQDMQITIREGMDPMEIENILVRFLRLKQICGTTGALDEESDDSYKLDRLVDMVDEITSNGERVVVFTQFRSIMRCIMERLAAVDIPAWSIHGDTPQRDRPSVVKEWGESDKPGAMVAMLQVAGVGLNMTQARKCIFVDKLFVPKLNEQAEDRLHRIGTGTQPVQIYSLYVKGSIENRVEQILRRKSKLFDDLIEQHSSKWKEMLIRAVMEDDEVEAA